MNQYIKTINHQIQQVNTQIQKNLKRWVNEISTPQDESILSTRAIQKSLVIKGMTKLVGQAIPFATRNGFRVVDYKPGYIKALIPLKPNRNHINTMYAGALFTVAELPGGILSMLNFDQRYFPVLRDMKIEYVQLVKSDVTVEFEISKPELARIEREALLHGKCDFVLEGEIKNGDQETVARTYANYQLRM